MIFYFQGYDWKELTKKDVDHVQATFTDLRLHKDKFSIKIYIYVFTLK